MKRLCILISVLLLPVSALAETIVMEIFYLPHRPALAVTQKIEQSVADLQFVAIKKYSFENPASQSLIKKYDLADHMPIAIFIDGKDRHSIAGKEIIFRNFPKGDAFVPTFSGGWSYEDLKSVLISLEPKRQ